MSELTTKNVQGLLSSESVKNRLEEILGKRASTFAASVVQIVKSNKLLSEAEPNSVVGAAMTAATLDLPINNSIGFAYIIPFKNNKEKNVQAQFQIGYKGFIQLAQRSGQFKTINVTDVRDGEILSRDRQTGEIEFGWIQNDDQRNKKKIVGYVAYFSLLNGFEKSHYLSVEELRAHATKYSQTYKRGFGQWKDDEDGMSRKTVIKLLLSKYAPLSVDMRTAVLTDQGTFNKFDDPDSVKFPDNEPPTKPDGDKERLVKLIEGATTQEELDFAKGHATEEILPLIKKKQKELNESKK